MKKNLFLTALTIGFLTCNISFADNYKNDLKTLFLNNQAVIYEINIRSFNADDKDGNELVEIEKGEIRGNFLNAVDRLDEIKRYGFNAVHLLPITPVGKIKAIGTAGSLYAMDDISSLNKNLADRNSKLTAEEQFKKFVEECHKRNIRVIVDIPACGSVDFSQKNPDLFVKDKNGEPVIPVDWTDVRLFKTVEKDGSLNKELLDEHKKFVDLMLWAGVDGIRADVAPIKPKKFWQELINYTRQKDSEFMFLAETAEAWAPPKVPSPTADYKKLLEAGFDGYYGNLLDFMNFKSSKDFDFVFKHINKLAKKGIKKSVIGCFSTHDLKSVYVTSPDLAKSVMLMNATLPVNPYYLDGFHSGDKYDYSYSDKKIDVTYTDTNIAHTHKNQIDIFNYSRKPGGNMPEMADFLKYSLSLRESFGDLVTKGSFKMLKTSQKDVFAYERRLNNEVLITVVNTNHTNTKKVDIYPSATGEIQEIECIGNKEDSFVYDKHLKIIKTLKVKLKADNAVIIKYILKDNKKK